MGTNTPVPSPAVLKNRGVPVSVHVLVSDTGTDTMPPERVIDDTGEFVFETAYIKLDNNALADIEDALHGFGSLAKWQEELDATPYRAMRRTLAICWRMDQNSRADLLRVGARLVDGEDDQYATALAIAFMLANGTDPTQASRLLVKEAALRAENRDRAIASVEKTLLAQQDDKEPDKSQTQNETPDDGTPGTSGSSSGPEPDEPSESSGT